MKLTLIAGLLASALLVAAFGGACSSDCTFDCEAVAEDRITAFEGRLEVRGDSVDSRPSVFAGIDGSRFEVLVRGNEDALAVGGDYRVRATTVSGGLLETSLPGGCSCLPQMTHADGHAIDTSGDGRVVGDWAIFLLATVVVTAFVGIAWYAWRTRDPEYDYLYENDGPYFDEGDDDFGADRGPIDS